MPKPPKLPPPDPAEVRKLATHLATTGPMPWCLAVFKAEQQLRERVKRKNPVLNTAARKAVTARLGIPGAWLN